MGKPMTLASLKRDLEEMTRRAALAECRAEVACRAVDDLAHMIDRYQADLSAIKDALDGFSGAMGSGANAVVVQGAFVADEREDYDDIVQMYRSGRDYFIHHGEL